VLVAASYIARKEMDRLNRRWYLARDNEVFGPYVRGQILQWLRERKIIDSDLIRREDISEWKRIDRCAELQAEVKMSIEEKGGWLEKIASLFKERKRHGPWEK
jgi:hypothetical protein